MNDVPPPAFANRYTGYEDFNGVAEGQIERFFNSVATFVFSEVLGPLVSSYAAVRYDLINQAIAQAHQTAAMELGKNGLFPMTRALLDHETCYAEDSSASAHGAGGAEQPKLSRHQAGWAIEFCMIWVKSLIVRM